MNINIIKELKKFLNEPKQISLEISFSRFESALYMLLQVVRDMPSKKDILKVILVKNKEAGTVSFFFADGPVYQFVLNVDQVYLYNDNNSNECIIREFRQVPNEPISGASLQIFSDTIIVICYPNDRNKGNQNNLLRIKQVYMWCESIESYDYSLMSDNSQKNNPKETVKNTNNSPKGSDIFSKIGIAIFIICVIGLISNIVGSSSTSGTNSYETDYDSEIDTSFVDTTGTDDYTSVDPSNDNSEVSENWVQQYYSNFSFSLPESMIFNYGESSQNQKVYTDEESNIGITLVRSRLPEGQENESIRSLIGYNTREFAEDVSQNLKNHFTDIQLVDYNYGVLGNIEAFIVRNKSTEFSGKYIDMEIKNFLMISSPDYYSITLVYPENSISAKEIVSKIIDSFNDQNVTYSKSYESDDYSSSNRTTNRYMANQDRVYFYSDPGFNIRKNSYLVYGDYVESSIEKNGFIYVVYKSPNGITTEGWIPLIDLK